MQCTCTTDVLLLCIVLPILLWVYFCLPSQRSKNLISAIAATAANKKTNSWWYDTNTCMVSRSLCLALSFSPSCSLSLPHSLARVLSLALSLLLSRSLSLALSLSGSLALSLSRSCALSLSRSLSHTNVHTLVITRWPSLYPCASFSDTKAIQLWDTAHPHMHDVCIYVTGHVYMWHESCLYVTWLMSPSDIEGTPHLSNYSTGSRQLLDSLNGEFSAELSPRWTRMFMSLHNQVTSVHEYIESCPYTWIHQVYRKRWVLCEPLYPCPYLIESRPYMSTPSHVPTYTMPI